MPARWRVLWERRIGAFMVVGALLAGGLYWHQVDQQEDRSACQALYNSAFIDVITIRSTLNAQRQDAVDAVLSGVGKLVAGPPSEDPKVQAKRSKEFLGLFKDYTVAIEAYNTARDATPLPDLPPDC